MRSSLALTLVILLGPVTSAAAPIGPYAAKTVARAIAIIVQRPEAIEFNRVLGGNVRWQGTADIVLRREGADVRYCPNDVFAFGDYEGLDGYPIEWRWEIDVRHRIVRGPSRVVGNPLHFPLLADVPEAQPPVRDRCIDGSKPVPMTD